MKRLLVAAFFCSALVGCKPDIKKVEAPTLVTANFDPAAVPPVVPSPNDLAQDPSGQVMVSPNPKSSPADLEFIDYLNTLNGFTPGSTATETFSGPLDPNTVNASSVRVIDLTAGNSVVTDAVITSGSSDSAPGIISALPPLGWKFDHRYMVAILGGANGVHGAGGEPVVGSSTWFLIRSENSLVTGCTVPAPGQGCQAATSIIPTTETNPEAQLADRAAKAIQLEQLRLKYKPLVDQIIATGVAREDIAMLWSFKIGTNPSPVFDPGAAPPRVPRPIDLAIDPITGLVNAPVPAGASPAEAEFIRDYLNTLNGFPQTSPSEISIAGGPLNAATISPATVLVIDTTFASASPDAGVTPPPIPTITYDPATQRILITLDPGEVWPKGHTIAVVMIGGAGGIKGAAGEELVAAPAWALARSSEPLVNCEDLTDPTCASVITATSLSKSQAVGLEQIRRGFAPLLDSLPVPREDIPLAFAFTIMDHPEATFDLTTQVVPFPNDLVVNPATGRVNLPNPGSNPLITGLNTLDGFSTTGAAITENSSTLGAYTDGQVDEASLLGGTAFLKLTQGGLQPIVKACVDCTSSLLRDGGTPQTPDQIQFVPEVPLDEKSQYAAVLKTTATDTTGRQVRPTGQFAFVRMANPLVDGSNHSTVAQLTDTQAQQLEPARLLFKQLFDVLAAAGIPRKDIAVGWNFRTQSIINSGPINPGLQPLHDLPGTLAIPTAADFLQDVTTDVIARATDAGIPTTDIGTVYAGSYTSTLLLTPPDFVFGPPPGTPSHIPFLLTVPTGASPGDDFPVVMFGHGLTRSRMDMTAIANTLAAAGFATIAVDAVWHGERTTCLGFGASDGPGGRVDNDACLPPATCSAAGRCTNAAAATACDLGSTGGIAGDVFCSNQRLGRCVSNVCEGGDFLRIFDLGDPAQRNDPTPVASGWNLIRGDNFFATRDNFRQQVIDLGQLNRVLKDASVNGIQSRVGAGILNGDSLYYAGQSLGGMMGTLYTAVAPEISNAVMNVPGGDLPTLIFQSVNFAPFKNALLTTLEGQGIFSGTPGFDQFIYFARMILDPATTTNAGVALTNGEGLPASRAALIQFIQDDQTIPNASTETLVAAATRPGTPKTAAVFLFGPPATDSVPLQARHSFLLSPTTLTGTAQAQLAQFLLTGVQP